MNAAELAAAAAKIERAASEARRKAAKAQDPDWAGLHEGVAQQFDDRASQIRSWAERAEYTGEVTADMEAATREALKYAGCE